MRQEMPEWVNTREAAEILGVRPSAIPKMRRRGDLTARPDGRRPAWSRAEVLELAETRRAAEVERERSRDRSPRKPSPPDDVHTWLLIKPAAVVLSIGANTLSNRGVCCTDR